MKRTRVARAFAGSTLDRSGYLDHCTSTTSIAQATSTMQQPQLESTSAAAVVASASASTAASPPPLQCVNPTTGAIIMSTSSPSSVSMCPQLSLNLANSVQPDLSSVTLQGSKPAGYIVVQTCTLGFVFNGTNSPVDVYQQVAAAKTRALSPLAAAPPRLDARRPAIGRLTPTLRAAPVWHKTTQARRLRMHTPTKRQHHFLFIV